MTISLRAVGATTLVSAAVTPLVPGVPAGVTSSDISILTVQIKGDTAGVTPTITTPTGWNLIGTVTNNGTLAAANDTGSNTVGMYWRYGTYTAPSIATTGANSAGAVIVAYQGTVGYWVTAFGVVTTGSDTTSGANGSAAGSSITTVTGDWLLVGGGLSGDLGTITARTLAQAGATLSTLVTRAEFAITTNMDSRLLAYDVPVTAGGTGVPTFTWTNTSALTGIVEFVALREVALSAPGTPTSVSATGGVGKVTVAWTAPTGMPATSYTVYRNGSSLATGVTAVTYDDTTGTPGTSYSYTVAAVNGAGASSQSSGQSAASSAGYEGRTAVEADDWYNSAGVFNNSGSTLLAGYTAAASFYQGIGLRFTGVTLPQGATITSAVVYWRAGSATAEVAPILAIKGVPADNPVAPTTLAEYTALASTTASVAYTPSYPTPDQNFDTQVTSDFSSVVQEIVNRPGWASGNAMIIKIDDNGSLNNGGNNFINMAGRVSGVAPRLRVTYTPASTDPLRPKIVSNSMANTKHRSHNW